MTNNSNELPDRQFFRKKKATSARTWVFWLGVATILGYAFSLIDVLIVICDEIIWTPIRNMSYYAPSIFRWCYNLLVAHTKIGLWGSIFAWAFIAFTAVSFIAFIFLLGKRIKNFFSKKGPDPLNTIIQNAEFDSKQDNIDNLEGVLKRHNEKAGYLFVETKVTFDKDGHCSIVNEFHSDFKKWFESKQDVNSAYYTLQDLLNALQKACGVDNSSQTAATIESVKQLLCGRYRGDGKENAAVPQLILAGLKAESTIIQDSNKTNDEKKEARERAMLLHVLEAMCSVLSKENLEKPIPDLYYKACCALKKRERKLYERIIEGMITFVSKIGPQIVSGMLLYWIIWAAYWFLSDGITQTTQYSPLFNLINAIIPTVWLLLRIFYVLYNWRSDYKNERPNTKKNPGLLAAYENTALEAKQISVVQVYLADCRTRTVVEEADEKVEVQEQEKLLQKAGTQPVLITEHNRVYELLVYFLNTEQKTKLTLKSKLKPTKPWEDSELKHPAKKAGFALISFILCTAVVWVYLILIATFIYVAKNHSWSMSGAFGTWYGPVLYALIGVSALVGAVCSWRLTRKNAKQWRLFFTNTTFFINCWIRGGFATWAYVSIIYILSQKGSWRVLIASDGFQTTALIASMISGLFTLLLIGWRYAHFSKNMEEPKASEESGGDQLMEVIEDCGYYHPNKKLRLPKVNEAQQKQIGEMIALYQKILDSNDGNPPADISNTPLGDFLGYEKYPWLWGYCARIITFLQCSFKLELFGRHSLGRLLSLSFIVLLSKAELYLSFGLLLLGGIFSVIQFFEKEQEKKIKSTQRAIEQLDTLHALLKMRAQKRGIAVVIEDHVLKANTSSDLTILDGLLKDNSKSVFLNDQGSLERKTDIDSDKNIYNLPAKSLKKYALSVKERARSLDDNNVKIQTSRPRSQTALN